MADIEVSTLKLRCRADERDRTRFAVEDGLRTSLPNPQRLMLVRKMRFAADLGSLQPGARQRAVTEGWLAATAGARHGGEDGAADSNCVWFASREEAEVLLLSRLLAGRSVDAWYWPLALPRWDGRGVRQWALEQVAEAISGSDDRRLLAIAQCFVSAASESLFIELLSVPGGEPRPAVGAGPAEGEAAPPPVAPFMPARAFARKAAAARAAMLPPPIRTLLQALVRGGAGARSAAIAIARAWAIRDSPALALLPALLPEIAEAIVGEAVSSLAPDRKLDKPASDGDSAAPTLAAARPASAATAPPNARDRPRPDPPGIAKPSAARARGDPAADRHSEGEGPSPAAASPAPQTLASSHAGLWLVVPSLIDLGFREWLALRPRLLVGNPGARLLQEIARHHRVAPDDPALFALGRWPKGPRPEWARLWRHGLDRWLRRTVRRRLHDLVNRPGLIELGELAVTVRYPAEATDLALRREALDRDPGWTDWLGLSVRYDFAGPEGWL